MPFVLRAWEFLPPLLVNSNLMKIRGSRRDFLLACPIALAAASACYVLPDRWFTPHFAVYAEFSLSAWDATVDRASAFPLWPATWLQCPDLGTLPLKRFGIFGMSISVKLVLFWQLLQLP